MRRKLIAAYVASALLGSTGLAFAHSDTVSDASTPSGVNILNSTTMDESSSSSLPAESASVPSDSVSLPSASDDNSIAPDPASSDVTVLERYEADSASAGSSLPSGASEPSTDVSSLPPEVPSAMSGIDASTDMQDSASSESSASEHSAPQSYSLYPETSER